MCSLSPFENSEYILNRFKLYARKWQSWLNLHDWSIGLTIGEVDDEENAAETAWNANNRVALITIDQDITEWTDRLIERLVLHEMLEIRLSGLRDQAAKYDNWDLADKEVHTIIRVFENRLLGHG